MLDRTTLLALFDSMLPSLAYNLDFIPADKLDWKPAPEAKSALEIVNHLVGFLDSVSCRLSGEPSALTPATNADEAKRLLSSVGARFASTVRDASPEAMGEQFNEEYPFTNGWMVTADIIDVIHHGGQLAYIQTLLGDTEDHFDEANIPDFASN